MSNTTKERVTCPMPGCRWWTDYKVREAGEPDDRFYARLRGAELRRDKHFTEKHNERMPW